MSTSRIVDSAALKFAIAVLVLSSAKPIRLCAAPIEPSALLTTFRALSRIGKRRLRASLRADVRRVDVEARRARGEVDGRRERHEVVRRVLTGRRADQEVRAEVPALTLTDVTVERRTGRTRC